jgi:RNA polymerase sigma-70 factor, ECF subfamily
VDDVLELAITVPVRAAVGTGADEAVAPRHVDAGLVEAARHGDRTAFAALYSRYVRMVHGVLLASVPRLEVDDLVQDVFLTALRRLDSLRDSSAFPAWLATIARHRATDYFRRTSNREQELTEDVAAPVVDRDDAMAVLAAVRALPEAYRETLVLRLVEGMTGQEIASRTGLTHASVRVNLHRGMKLLRERLAGSATP